MRVIRQSAFAVVPWKNGGGVTHEAIRVPPAGDPFEWRLSVARIDAAGPFSNFAGYHRYLVLLQGAGVVLKFSRPAAASGSDDGPGDRDCDQLRELRSVGDWAEFDGGLATHCELVNGPCMDLNLMVSKTLSGVRVRVEELREARSFALGRLDSLLVVPIDASVELAGGEVRLDPWDVALLSGREERQVQIARSGGEEGAARAKLLVAHLPPS